MAGSAELPAPSGFRSAVARLPEASGPARRSGSSVSAAAPLGADPSPELSAASVIPRATCCPADEPGRTSGVGSCAILAAEFAGVSEPAPPEEERPPASGPPGASRAARSSEPVPGAVNPGVGLSSNAGPVATCPSAPLSSGATVPAGASASAEAIRSGASEGAAPGADPGPAPTASCRAKAPSPRGDSAPVIPVPSTSPADCALAGSTGGRSFGGKIGAGAFGPAAPSSADATRSEAAGAPPATEPAPESAPPREAS